MSDSPAVCLLCTLEDWELCLAALERGGGNIETVDLVVVDRLAALPVRGLTVTVELRQDGSTTPHPLTRLRN